MLITTFCSNSDNLRKTLRHILSLLTSHKKRLKAIPDSQWCTTKYQRQSADRSGERSTLFPNKGFRDSDGCSSYANSVM